MDKFGVESSNQAARAKRYLQEEPIVAADWARLDNTRERLEQVIKAIADFDLQMSCFLDA
jgi:SepF-like predicted cell division protein (DUF552 family)